VNVVIYSTLNIDSIHYTSPFNVDYKTLFNLARTRGLKFREKIF
jgi:hypothetical protein